MCVCARARVCMCVCSVCISPHANTMPLTTTTAATRARARLHIPYTQVRVGVLNAAHHGVPQSRSRTFIWAALPGERLPHWPQPLHAFDHTMLSLPVPVPAWVLEHPDCVAALQRDNANVTVQDRGGRGDGGGEGVATLRYWAASPAAGGAPLRPVTVWDAVSDLAPVDNADGNDWRCVRWAGARARHVRGLGAG